jgi:hypothetical protein
MAYPLVLPFSRNNPFTGISSPPPGVLLHTPQVDLGPSFGGASYEFFLTGTSTPANVYQDGYLTVPFSPTGVVPADNYGRFPAIYLDNSIAYKVQLYNNGGALIRTTDPYNVALATTGSSSVEAIGLAVNGAGEYTLLAPSAGGSGVTLTLYATAANNGAALAMIGNTPGTPLLIVNNSVTTGAQTATFTATNKPGTATSAPAGWLPIQCDGALYYAPIWFDNNFRRYSFAGLAIEAPDIVAASFTLNGNGSLTLVGMGATANPTWWVSPSQTNAGAGYWINITKTGGDAGESFTAAQGAWTNITNSGLAIAANSGGTITGTYQISSSVTGSPVLGNGTISLSGGNGPQMLTIVVGALTFNTDGTITYVGGSNPGNWFVPTTPGEGSDYYLQMNATGGVGTLGGITAGAYTLMSPALSVYGIAGIPGEPGQVSGTYNISLTNTSAGNVVSGAFDLQDQSVAANFPYSYDFPASTGVTFGSNGSNWYDPVTTGIGSGYWLTVTVVSGSGTLVGITAGTPTNMGSNITLSTTGSSLACTYTISNSATGAPILCQGTFGLTVAPFGGQTDTFSTAGTFTETIPSGSSQVVMEVWGGSGSGGGGTYPTKPYTSGGGGGSGGYNKTTVSLSSADWGKTITATIGAPGTASTLTSGTKAITTMTSNTGAGGGGGVVGTPGAGGAAGSASGGATHSSGNAGVTGGAGGAGIVGTNGTGNGGGAGNIMSGVAGSNGLAVLKYT